MEDLRPVAEILGDENTTHARRIELLDEQIAKLKAANLDLQRQIDDLHTSFRVVG